GLAACLALVNHGLANAAPVPLGEGEVLLEGAKERGESSHGKPMSRNDEQDGVAAVFAADVHPLLGAVDEDEAAFGNAALRADGKGLAGAALTERAIHQGTGEHERDEATEAQEESGEHTVLPCVCERSDERRATGMSLSDVV